MQICYSYSMAEIKTKVTKASVTAFLKTVEPLARREEARALLSLCTEVTGETAKLWGAAMVGFGSYRYESTRSAQKGDWPLLAFSPRKQALTMYIMPGFADYGDLLEKLGKHTTSVGCLYIKRLSDVDMAVLKRLIKRAYTDMKKRHAR